MKYDVRNEKGLRVEQVIDSKSGDVQLTYWVDGNRASKIALIGNVAERYAGLTLILKDLDSSLRWIKKSATISNLPTVDQDKKCFVLPDEVAADAKAFFVAAVVFYAKAFVESKGRRAQLSRDSLDGDFRELHDDAMRFRHNMAAHSGEERLEAVESFILLVKGQSGKYDYKLATGGKQPAFADFGDQGNQSKSFAALIEHAAEKVHERLEKLGQQLLLAAAAIRTNVILSLAKKGKPLNLDEAIKRHSEARNRNQS